MAEKALKTVHDVARTAGVSVATISRVLNQHPNVSPKTREKVLALIQQSGFRPNAIARRLAHGRSGLLCFLLSNRDIIHSFHSRVLKGVEDYCQQQHRHVIFTTFDYGPSDAMPAETLPRPLPELDQWLKACRGGPATEASFERAWPWSQTIMLGNIALRVNKKLLWDAGARRFKNSPDADALLTRAYRPGWEL